MDAFQRYSTYDVRPSTNFFIHPRHFDSLYPYDFHLNLLAEPQRISQQIGSLSCESSTHPHFLAAIPETEKPYQIRDRSKPQFFPTMLRHNPYPDTPLAPRNVTVPPRPSSMSQTVAVRSLLQRPPIPEVSGYLYHLGKANDDHRGKYLELVLQNKNVDLDKAAPFLAVTDKTCYTSHGVIKINNIPFTVSAQEIVQFIHRYAPIPMLKKNHEGYPIHIIMEKPTGKTMDCFVEFPSHKAAHECVRRFEYTAHPGRGNKLGTRHVTLDLSNQAELMQAIFPRARLVEFDAVDGKPTIIRRRGHDDWSEGFRGYFTLEEIYGVTRFAESPSRSPFVLKCHQRVYECMISTLYKFPWAATQTYTIAARNALFEAAHKQLTTLSRKVCCSNSPSAGSQLVPYRYKQDAHQQHYSLHMRCGSQSDQCSIDLDSDSGQDIMKEHHREVGLGQSLLFDLLFAAVNVPAFSLLQKHSLCQAAGSYGRGIPLNVFGVTWPFQTLEPAATTPDHVIKFWLELFDTGFDIMTAQGQYTTFEDYILFTRNNIGFPIGEWTSTGLELPFEDAVRVEQAVAMQYIIRGREAWAQERQIKVSEWQGQTLPELMELIAKENYTSQNLERNETKSTDPSDREISPKSSGTWNIVEIQSQGDSGTGLGAVEIPGPQRSLIKDGKLDAATAIDFVPARMRQTPSDEHVSHKVYKQSGAAKTAKLEVNTRIANTHTSGRGVFTNPFISDPLVNHQPISAISCTTPKTVLSPLSPSEISPAESLSESVYTSQATSAYLKSRSLCHASTTSLLQRTSQTNDIGESFRKLSMTTDPLGSNFSNDSAPRKRSTPLVATDQPSAQQKPKHSTERHSIPSTSTNFNKSTYGPNHYYKHEQRSSMSHFLLHGSTVLSPTALDSPSADTSTNSSASALPANFRKLSEADSSIYSYNPQQARNSLPRSTRPQTRDFGPIGAPRFPSSSNESVTQRSSIPGTGRHVSWMRDSFGEADKQRAQSIPLTYNASRGTERRQAAYGESEQDDREGKSGQPIGKLGRLSASELWEGVQGRARQTW